MNTLSESPQKIGSRNIPFVLFILGLISIVIAFFIDISDNPPGILLLLIGLFMLFLGFVYFFGRKGKRKPAHTFLYWSPRVLGIVYAFLILLPSFEFIGQAEGFWGTTVALLLSLIPTFVIIGVLIVSWRREWIGGILFTTLALLLIVLGTGKFLDSTSAIILSVPLFIIGILFLLNWRYRGYLRLSSQA